MRGVRYRGLAPAFCDLRGALFQTVTEVINVAHLIPNDGMGSYLHLSPTFWDSIQDPARERLQQKDICPGHHLIGPDPPAGSLQQLGDGFQFFRCDVIFATARLPG